MARRGHGDGGIDERGDGRWRLRWRKEGKRYSRPFRGTLSEAKQELRNVHEGDNLAPSRLSVGEWLRKWLSEAPNRSPKTLERYRQLAERQILPHLAGIPLQKLTPARVSAWHGELLRAGRVDGGPLAAYTVGHAHRVLHVALAEAALRELVSRNVASLVRPPKVQAAEVRSLTAPEVGQVLAALADHRLFPIAALAIGCGLRCAELCALRWGDVDAEAGRLRVRASLEQTGAGLRVKEPKTKHGRRMVALPEIASGALRDHWRGQLESRLARGLGRPAAEDWVFTQEDGSIMPPRYLSRLWKRAVDARGLPKIGLHGLRHSHASALIAAGVDPLTISRRLGHANPAFTFSVYGHLFADTDTAAARAFDASLGTVLGTKT